MRVSGLSVSRVGGSAQTKMIKKLGGGVRLALAQYRELAAFAQFASDLDATTRAQLERGQKVTELMKQPQYSPLSVAEMGISLYAVNEGHLDEIDQKDVLAYERGLHDHLNSNFAELADKTNKKGAWDKDIEAEFKACVDSFNKTGSW